MPDACRAWGAVHAPASTHDVQVARQPTFPVCAAAFDRSRRRIVHAVGCKADAGLGWKRCWRGWRQAPASLYGDGHLSRCLHLLLRHAQSARCASSAIGLTARCRGHGACVVRHPGRGGPWTGDRRRSVGRTGHRWLTAGCLGAGGARYACTCTCIRLIICVCGAGRLPCCLCAGAQGVVGCRDGALKAISTDKGGCVGGMKMIRSHKFFVRAPGARARTKPRGLGVPSGPLPSVMLVPRPGRVEAVTAGGKDHACTLEPRTQQAADVTRPWPLTAGV